MPTGSDRSEVTVVRDGLDSGRGKMRARQCRCRRWRTLSGVWGDCWLVDDVSLFSLGDTKVRGPGIYRLMGRSRAGSPWR